MGVPCSCRVRAVERLRKQCATAASDPGQPAAIAKLVPILSAIAAVGNVQMTAGELSMMARLNSPLLNGEGTFTPM